MHPTPFKAKGGLRLLGIGTTLALLGACGQGGGMKPFDWDLRPGDVSTADAALNAALVGAPSTASPMAAATTAERRGH